MLACFNTDTSNKDSENKSQDIYLLELKSIIQFAVAWYYLGVL